MMNVKTRINLCMFFFREYAVRNIYVSYCGNERKSNLLLNGFSTIKNIIHEENNDFINEHATEIVNFFLRKYYHFEIKGSKYSIPQEDFFIIKEEDSLYSLGFNVDSVYSKLTNRAISKDALEFMFQLSSERGVYCTDAITLRQNFDMLEYNIDNIPNVTRDEFPVLKQILGENSSYISFSSAEFAVGFENIFSALKFSDSHHAFFVDTSDTDLSISDALSAIGKDLTYYTISRKLRDNIAITDDDWKNYEIYNEIAINNELDEKAYKRRLHALVMWDLRNIDGAVKAKSIRDAFYSLDINKDFCSVWSPGYTPPIDSWERSEIKKFCSQQASCYTQVNDWYKATEKSIADEKICPVKDKRREKPSKNKTLK